MSADTMSLDLIDKALTRARAASCQSVRLPRGVYYALGDIDDEALARLADKLAAMGAPGGDYYVMPIPFEQHWQLANAGRTDLPRKIKKAARGFMPWRLRERIKRQGRAGVIA